MNAADRDLSKSATWFQCMKTGARSADRVGVVPIRESAFEAVPVRLRRKLDIPHVTLAALLDDRKAFSIKVDGPTAIRLADMLRNAAESLTQGVMIKMPPTAQQAQTLAAIRTEMAPQLRAFADMLHRILAELQSLEKSIQEADPTALDSVQELMKELIGLCMTGDLRPGTFLQDMERQTIERAIATFGTHQKAAKFLGIGVRTISMKLAQYRKDDKAAKAANSSEAAAPPDEKEDKGPGASAA